MSPKLVASLLVAFFIGGVTAPAGAWDVPPEYWDTPGNGGNQTPSNPATPTNPATPVNPATPAPSAPGGSKNAIAESIVSGRVVLPTTGIRLELPALTAGATYSVSGRWGISDEDGSWSRDVIDEIRNKKLEGATWYYVGPFKAGGCKEVLDKQTIADAWRTTTTLYGTSFDVLGGSYIFKGGTLGTRPVVVLCGGTKERPMLIYRYFFDAGAPTALPRETLLSRVGNIPVLRELVTAHLAARWSRVKPLQAANVGTSDLLKYKRTVTLPQINATITIPDDGAYWKTESTTDSDSIARLVPRFPELGLHIFSPTNNLTCDRAFTNARESSKKEGRTLLPTLPSPEGWRSGLTYVKAPDQPRTLLCRQRGSRVVAVEVHHAAELGDLAELEPLLAAISTAIGGNAPPSTPTPPARVTPTPPSRPSKPTKPSKPTRHRTYRDDWGGFGSFDLGVAVSHRDSKALGRDEEKFPALRVAGPGMSMSMTTFETDGGLFLRYHVGLLPDVGSLFNDKAVSASRWGAQVWEAAVAVGFGVAVGDDDLVGLTVGWHGQSGPLLLNSSVAASLHWIHMPEDEEEFGWGVRVTPLQLIPSNERWLMSPLSVDLRLLGGGVSFGVEFQWVGKPDPGDEDIPGEGMAAIIRLGFGSFFF